MRFFLVIAGVLLFAGCTDKNDSSNVIPRDKMMNILFDMMQVDEFANVYIVKDSTKNSKLERIKLYQHVFQLYGISREKFNSSFKYYSSRPDILKNMYDSLGSRSDRRRREVYMHKDSSKPK